MRIVDLKKERERKRREGFREIILHAAESVIIRDGYGAVTMDDIAREAQISKATLYRYFSGKRDLIFEIIIHYYDDQERSLEEILRRRTGAVEKLKSAIRSVLESSEKQMSVSRIFLLDESFLKLMKLSVAEPRKGASLPETRFLKSIGAKRDEVLAIAREILREGIASGEFRAVNIDVAVALMESLLQGILHLRFWQKGEPGLRPGTDSIFDFIFLGIRNPAGSGKGDTP